ncbi:hypothetical protein GIB67_042010 [Kingdonia uniflora]|uniref:Uncharacterized protein n=1 Tax=Kingdonia uniflora TaxID=39325 RepID=A0A7J7NZS7_9MAGN|nr:hypothetical protein GIB67_042010 [Kingdonia uniflora]
MNISFPQNGAAYCTSELVVLKNNEIRTWDRGYDDDDDDDDNQVCRHVNALAELILVVPQDGPRLFQAHKLVKTNVSESQIKDSERNWMVFPIPYHMVAGGRVNFRAS